jgi:hypothetical protein
VLLGLLAIGWLWLRHVSSPAPRGEFPGVTVDKQAENFAQRTFDRSDPPADMPPMTPGEAAVCDSNFISNVSVGGRAEKTDDTHEIVTITQVHVTLQLAITIWAPADATQHVIEHEEGHREISEFYYRDADKLAERIAAGYIGKKDLVHGADLNAAFNTWLQQEGADITDEYDAELNPGPTQLRYDEITDHARNDVVAKDAVAQAIAEAGAATGGNAGN